MGRPATSRTGHPSNRNPALTGRQSPHARVTQKWQILNHALPDRLGGSRVALVSLTVEAVGLLLIASASRPIAALLGTVITGLGYSMVFPSLGVGAVRRVPAESHGGALGIFPACFDLGLGAAGPAAGLVASGFGLSAAFVAASAAALVSLGVVWRSGSRPLSRP